MKKSLSLKHVYISNLWKRWILSSLLKQRLCLIYVYFIRSNVSSCFSNVDILDEEPFSVKARFSTKQQQIADTPFLSADTPFYLFFFSP